MTNTIYVNWEGHNIKLTWMPFSTISDISQVTSVHGYCFYNGKVLLVNIKGRGWNAPGGHVEEGETPEEAFHREAYEEGYVRGRVQYIGAIEVSHEENPLFNPNGKYPLKGYQLFYRMDVEECLDFLGEHEAASRLWVSPEKVPNLIDDHSLAGMILKEAILINS